MESRRLLVKVSGLSNVLIPENLIVYAQQVTNVNGKGSFSIGDEVTIDMLNGTKCRGRVIDIFEQDISSLCIRRHMEVNANEPQSNRSSDPNRPLLQCDFKSQFSKAIENKRNAESRFSKGPST